MNLNKIITMVEIITNYGWITPLNNEKADSI